MKAMLICVRVRVEITMSNETNADLCESQGRNNNVQ